MRATDAYYPQVQVLIHQRRRSRGAATAPTGASREAGRDEMRSPLRHLDTNSLKVCVGVELEAVPWMTVHWPIVLAATLRSCTRGVACRQVIGRLPDPLPVRREKQKRKQTSRDGADTARQVVGRIWAAGTGRHASGHDLMCSRTRRHMATVLRTD